MKESPQLVGTTNNAEVKARKVRKIIRHLKLQPDDAVAFDALERLAGVPKGFEEQLAIRLSAKRAKLEAARIRWLRHHSQKFAAYKARVAKAKKAKAVTTRSKPTTFTFADLERLLAS